MYCSHFGLHRPPFNNTPDPTFYFSTPEHEEALATLRYATEERKGFVLVTGEVGAGKTLTGRMFLRQIEPDAETAVITHTHLSGRQLLAAVCTEFGLNPRPEASNLDLTQLLQDFLLEQYARNRYVVVLIDEAQNLPDEAFEELRMLGNLEADDAKLLQVCILGQPELRSRFAQPNLRQLEQRLFSRFHLTALAPERTRQYIQHRLKVAGCTDGHLFTPEAIDRVFLQSKGIPRLINQVCDNALLTAYGENTRIIDGRIINEITERERSRTSPATAGFQDGPPSRTADRQSVSSAGTREALGSLTRSIDECVQTIVEGSNSTAPDITAPAPPQNEPNQNADTGRQESRFSVSETDEPGAQGPGQLDPSPRNEPKPASQTAREQPRRSRIAEFVEGALHRGPRKADGVRKTAAERPSPAPGDKAAAADARACERRHDEQAKAVSQLNEKIKAREAEVSGLNEQMVTRLDETEAALQRLDQRSVTTEDLLRIKSDHAAAVAEINQKLADNSVALKVLRASIDERLKVADGPSPEFQALSRRVIEQAQQVQEIRKKLLAQYSAVNQCLSEMSDKLVSRTELEAFRTAQARQNDEILDKIESNREAVQEMLDDLAERYRTTRDQVEAVVADKVEAKEFSEFRARQDEEVARLLQMLDTQRREIEARFDQAVAQWKGTQSNLEQLAASAADAKALEEVRKQQTHDAARILGLVGAHRREFEKLVKEVNGRCEELVQRFNALPKGIATTDQLNSIREAYTEQITDLTRRLTAREADLEKVHERQDRSLRAVAGKALDTAKRVSVLEEKGRPRRIHLELTPTAGVELGDMVVSAQTHRDFLKGEIDEGQRIASELRETSSTIEKTVQAWEKRAEEARSQATDALGIWQTGVEEVRQESERLKASAKMAADILVKMRRCNTALDAKLNSELWQAEFKRSEELVIRLEHAAGTAQSLCQQLTDRANDLAQQVVQYKKDMSERLEQGIASARSVAQQLTDRVAWSRNELSEQMNECRAELAEQLEQCKKELADRMTRFVAEQSQIDQVIEDRRQLLANIARNASNLAEVIEAGREFEETRQPAPSSRAPSTEAREVKTDKVQEIRWPRLKTHKAKAV